MGDHGASAIIPVNIFMMFACVAIAAFTLPWWMALGVCLLMLTIRGFARDQYGGMQICLLLLPGLLAGIMITAQYLHDTRESGGAVDWLLVIVLTVVSILLFPIAIFVMMAIPVAAVLAWEWFRGRTRNGNTK